MTRLLRALAAIFVLAGAASAATWVVKPDGTGDFPNIQSAVSAAADGDEILLADGTFSGPGNRSVDFLGRAITVRSASGDPDACVIDHTLGGPYGFRFVSGETPVSVLSGVSLVNAQWAIRCDGSDPTLRDLVIRNFTSGGISGFYSSARVENVVVRDGVTPAISFVAAGVAPVITGCVIEANASPGSFSHGTVIIRGPDALVENCRIVGNAAGLAPPWQTGGIAVNNASPVIRNCLIAGNTGLKGGGVLAWGFVPSRGPTIEGCTIASNRAGAGGGIYTGQVVTVRVERSIVWGNCASSGNEAHIEAGATLEVTCTDLEIAEVSGTGTLVLLSDVFAFDPLFCGAIGCGAAPSTGGLYTLAENSPALTQSCGPLGALGAGCGPTGLGWALESASWGVVKSLYR